MKKLISLLVVALMITSCSPKEMEVKISSKVAVVYNNGEKDTILIDEKFTVRDTSLVSVYLRSNDGASCLVIGSYWGYNSLACGVRKIQIINFNKTVKEL